MKSKADELLGYCGLYCGNCTYYINTVKGIGTVNDGITVFCEGCNSSHTTPWCTDCVIKKCGRKKEIRYCLKCSDYPCKDMKEFMENPLYPYHLEVPETMKRLGEITLEEWAEEMEQNYTCKNCGKHYTYFERHCPDCSKK
jgi:hypothetical protein